MKHFLGLTFTCCICLFGFSQDSDTIFNNSKNGITKPNILSTHPFGILFSRVQGNFKINATQKTILNIGIESGNVWAAPVQAFIPNNNDVRERVKKTPWHGREFAYDYESLDAKTIALQFDGIIKGLRANASFNIGKQHELNVGMRMYMLTNGKLPFSSITGDSFIEFFHRNIAGGDDPFGRELFGLNKAKIIYKDSNDKTLELTNGDLLIGGIETSYYYYPEKLINTNNSFFMNFGTHLGTNLSKYNSSIDFGFSLNAIKIYKINPRNYFYLAASVGGTKKNIIEFNNDNINLGTNNFIGYLESALEFNTVSKGKTTHSFGIDFYLQTSFNKRKEFDYLIPIRNGVTEKSWVTGISHLYKNNNYWTFLYSFTRKITTTFYIQQDLTLNNSPDIQTGLSIAFSL